MGSHLRLSSWRTLRLEGASPAAEQLCRWPDQLKALSGRQASPGKSVPAPQLAFSLPTSRPLSVWAFILRAEEPASLAKSHSNDH
ncbi:hypothetical protein Cadr_000022361 [Camelus dromedarius]|uniref:Uncharacterized protein n=1 Tax=Camelus dromedarius TaxID=9838 RepID=A0A5N4CQE3_CAMDR|nr:hypothetical protein Cadr_000022361 [Camelus dromedarius]